MKKKSPKLKDKKKKKKNKKNIKIPDG